MYIVMTSSASMPAKVKAPYQKVALVELEPGYSFDHPPKMISERARGLKRIVELRDRLHAKGVNCAAARARAELTLEAARLNATDIDAILGSV